MCCLIAQNLTHLRVTLDGPLSTNLARLPLTHLHLSVRSGGVIPNLPPSLRLLALDSLTEGPFTFSAPLNLPNLRSLHLLCLRLSDQVQSLLSRVVTNDLVSLTLWDVSDGDSPERLYDLLSHIRPSIRKLAIVPLEGPGPHSEVLSRFPHLRVLFYDFPIRGPIPDESIFIPPTVERLELHRNPSIDTVTQLIRQLEEPNFLPALTEFPILRCRFPRAAVPPQLHTQIIVTGNALLRRGLSYPRSDWIHWKAGAEVDWA